MFSCEFCKIFKNNYLQNTCEHTTAPTFSSIFMTDNFSYYNYDVVNSFNIWKKKKKKRILYWENSLFITLIYALYLFLYIFYHI